MIDEIIRDIQGQLVQNGTAYLKAPRQVGDTQIQAARRLHRRLMKYRARHGLIMWRLNILDGGVMVTLRKNP